METTTRKTQLTLPSETEILITRRINAPRALVWAAWTQAEHLAKWWGPQGWTVPTCEVDFRVGGEWRYHMRGPIDEQGTMMDSFGLAEYTDIQPQTQFSYRDHFANSDWQIQPEMPTATSTVIFTDEGAATLVTNTSQYATQEARDAVIEMGMEAGMDQTLDRLEKLLALRALDRLVGTWDVTGGAVGQSRYEWLEGEHFLMQYYTLEQYGQTHKGMEVIGYEQPFGEAQGDDLKARVNDNHGNTLDYVYELEGDTLTIWGGEKGSPAYFRGTFSADDQTVTGEWVYPGGGGYPATMTRRPD